jgi:hypothetical protein
MVGKAEELECLGPFQPVLVATLGRLAAKAQDRHDVLTCPSSTFVGYVGDGIFHQHRATLRRAGRERV